MITKSLGVLQTHRYAAEESFQEGLSVVETVAWIWLQTVITAGSVDLGACSVVNAATVAA